MKTILLSFFFALGISSMAQFSPIESGTSDDPWFAGGGGNLSISTNFTQIGINPFVGYQFTDRLSAGVGVSAAYFKFFSNSDIFYGGNVFGRFLFSNELFAQSEFHMTNVGRFAGITENGETESERVWTQQFFVGGGYRTSISNNVFMNASVLFDLIDDENSPYQNPLINVGIQVGL